MKRSAYWRKKFFSVVLIVLFTVLISACTPGGYGVDPPPTPPGTAPIIISANRTIFTEATVGTFTVTATGTPAPTYAITGTLPSGVTFDTTTGVLSGLPAAGSIGTYPLTITASNGVPPDATQNFILKIIPLTVTGSDASYGSFTFDAEGNLLFVVNAADEIRLLDRSTGTVTTVATGVSGGSQLLGMIYSQGSIFVSSNNSNIYKVDPTNGSSTLFTIISSAVNGIVIAPATFGSYGGQLIVATYFGDIYAVDQSVASPTPVLIASLGVTASALIFGSDGTLYVADYFNHKILTVTAAGVVADFVTTGLNYPDGLAFGNGVLYVANSGDDTLKRVTIPGGIVSTLTSVDFDDGWYPSPIIYDATSNILIMGSGESSLTIIYYKP